MKLTFWGATDDVTGSMTFIEIGNKTILVDCGMVQGDEEKEKINFQDLPVPMSSISDIIITHAHLDHSGLLPRLVRKGFNGRIHCTIPTYQLLKIILLDSAKIDEEGLYGVNDVFDTVKLIVPHTFKRNFSIGDAEIWFHPVGHILGAASVSIKAENKHVVFSGDIGRQDDALMPPPPACEAADVVIMESTYGGQKRHGNMARELHSFLETLSKEQRVGIIASFAVARGQNILKLIHEYHQRHPKLDLRIVVDSPMMLEANRVYKEYAHMTNSPQDLLQSLTRLETIKTAGQWDDIKTETGPLLIISSSGMLTGGRIQRHIKAHSAEKDAILFLPGYQAPNTPGRGLLEGKRMLLDHRNNAFEWQGEVWSSDAFSSHADGPELVDWVTKNNSPSTKVFLIHGEEARKKALRKDLGERSFEALLPVRGESFHV